MYIKRPFQIINGSYSVKKESVNWDHNKIKKQNIEIKAKFIMKVFNIKKIGCC